MGLTVGSVFSGIGGNDLGFEYAGLSVVWQIEKDPFCRRVLKKHWPLVPCWTDVRECGRSNLQPVDSIVGGFPCQPFSLAGKRRGADDDRNLWPEMCRLVAELRPTYVVAENVPGIIRVYLDTVLSDLESLGYATGTITLPAAAFNAPHVRDRVFVLAYANREHTGHRHNGTGETVWNAAKEAAKRRDAIHDSINRHAQPGVPGSDHGVPDWMDRGGRLTWADGWDWMPKTSTVSLNRKNRLKALGNSAVPHVMYHIAMMIRMHSEERKNHDCIA